MRTSRVQDHSLTLILVVSGSSSQLHLYSHTTSRINKNVCMYALANIQLAVSDQIGQAFCNNSSRDLFFINTIILLVSLNYYSTNKKSSSKYATVPIFVSISFKLVLLQSKEFIRNCMGKEHFASQSRLNDFHTNPCKFPSFQIALKFFLRNINVRKFQPMHVYSRLFDPR